MKKFDFFESWEDTGKPAILEDGSPIIIKLNLTFTEIDKMQEIIDTANAAQQGAQWDWDDKQIRELAERHGWWGSESWWEQVIPRFRAMLFDELRKINYTDGN